MELIIGHINSDFDALGAMLAAQKLYPHARASFVGSPEPNVRKFLEEEGETLQKSLRLSKEKDIDIQQVSRLIIVDTQSRNRIGPFAQLLEQNSVDVVCYDHHPQTSDDFSPHQLYKKEYGAVCTLMAEILHQQGIRLSAFEATLMALGIYEDTGSFQNTVTTGEDFQATAWLFSLGADLPIVSTYLEKEFDSQQISLLSDLLESITHRSYSEIDVVFACAEREEYIADLALITNKIREIEQLRVVFVLVRMGQRIIVVARSANSGIDVGDVLRRLGGGGHKTAASASVREASLQTVFEKINTVLEQKIGYLTMAQTMMIPVEHAASPDLTIHEAQQLMQASHVAVLPVEMEQKLIGLIAYQDIEKACAHGLGEYSVRRCMIVAPETVDQNAPYFEVERLMLESQQTFLPVLSQGKTVGMISYKDLLNAVLTRKQGKMPNPDFSNLLPFLQKHVSITVWKIIRHLRNCADSLGLNIFIVGGFVRDLLLKRKSFDLDIVVEGDGIALAQRMAEELGAHGKYFHQFGTASLKIDDVHVDIATARVEHYPKPGALPTVQKSSIHYDLVRRDFTINCLAVQISGPTFGQLLDFFGARRDLQQGKIRVLHNLSFVEDPTRILRAIRFEQRFDFQMEANTLHLLESALDMQMLKTVECSRIRDELILILQETEPIKALNRLAEFEILKKIHAQLEIDDDSFRVFYEIRRVLDWYRLTEEAPIRQDWILFLFGILYKMSEKSSARFLQRYHFSKKIKNLVTEWHKLKKCEEKLRQATKDHQIYRICQNYSVEMILFWMAYLHDENSKKKISHYFMHLKHIQFAFTGKDLIALGWKANEQLGVILTILQNKVLDGMNIDAYNLQKIAESIQHSELVE